MTVEKVIDIEDSDEDTESLFNDSEDSELDLIFESISDYENESLDSDIDNMLLLQRRK